MVALTHDPDPKNMYLTTSGTAHRYIGNQRYTGRSCCIRDSSSFAGISWRSVGSWFRARPLRNPCKLTGLCLDGQIDH